MVATQKLTLEEYLARPEEKPYLEFVDGEIVQKAMPNLDHSMLQLEIGRQIKNSPLVANFRAMTECRFVFGEPLAAFLPDVSVVLRSRLPRDERGRHEAIPRIAPDIAFEVLSPGDRAGDVLRKLSFYMDNGVRLAVVIDADKRSATIHRPGETPQFVAPPEGVDLSPVIPGLVLDLGQLFAELDEE